MSIAGSCGDQDLRCGDSAGNHQFHLPGVFSMREYPDVATHAECNTRTAGRRESGTRLSNGLGWRIVSVPTLVVRNCIGGGQGGTVRHAVSAHESEDLWSSFAAMFDSVNACENRAAHALGRVGMSGDDAAGAVSGLDGGLHLGLSEGGPTGLTRSPVVVRVQLDHIRARADLVPDR